jgi:TPR repeat protein
MSVYEDAAKAFEQNDFDEIRNLLERLAHQGDLEAQMALGTFLIADESSYLEGIAWLRRAADQGHGQAAHNLAMELASGGPALPPDRAEFLKYMEIAYRSGFEAAVSSDPLWWRPKISTVD